MKLIGSRNTVLPIVYFKVQDRGWIFIAMKIHETEVKRHKTMKFHSKLFVVLTNCQRDICPLIDQEVYKNMSIPCIYSPPGKIYF